MELAHNIEHEKDFLTSNDKQDQDPSEQIEVFPLTSELQRRNSAARLNTHSYALDNRYLDPNVFLNYDPKTQNHASSTSSYIKPPPLPSPLKHLSNNLLSALSVSLINLPLCMAFATAGTMPPSVGIMSAFYCSIFIFLSDSKYSIISIPISIALLSKPLVKSYGYIGYQMALFLSGLMMMTSLMTKLYKYMVVIPKCVMDGFMNGGVLGIFVEQMETVFGISIDWEKLYDRPGDEYIGIQLVYGIKEVVRQWGNVNYLSFALYVFTIVALYALMQYYPSKPWVLYVCLFGLFVGFFEDFISTLRK